MILTSRNSPARAGRSPQASSETADPCATVAPDRAQTKGARSFRTAPRFRALRLASYQKIATLSTAPLMKAATTAEATRVRMVVIGIPLFCNSLCYWQGHKWCVATNCASAKKCVAVAKNATVWGFQRIARIRKGRPGSLRSAPNRLDQAAIRRCARRTPPGRRAASRARRRGAGW